MMKIYNSYSRKLEEFKPIEKNKVKMYVCGPTTYDYIHIGNARSLIVFDLINRYLIYKGFDVNFVQNITDIDDKIINKAIKEKKTEKEVADFYTTAFLSTCDNLNLLKPTKVVKVSDEIESIIEYVQKLIDNGSAYQTNDGVFLNVNKASNYGTLSNKKIDELEETEKSTNFDKHNSHDFSLWKNTKTGIKWSAFGSEGRPGWHTECFVIINKFLGNNIDIHGGGIDLIFPHHENEIAQHSCLHHNVLSNYWIHNGHLNINSQKMSKSLNNSIYVKDLLKKYSQNILRLFFMSSSYSSFLDFSDKTIEQFGKNWSSIELSIKKYLVWFDLPNTDINSLWMSEFEELMDNDFSTPQVLALINKFLKLINFDIQINLQKINKGEQPLITDLIKNMNAFIKILNILGFTFNKPDVNVKQAAKDYLFAKQQKDFATADTKMKLIETFLKQ